MKYKGPTYIAYNSNGYPCYQGPLRRARLWARIYGGTFEELV